MATARWTAPARWSTGIAALLLAVSMLSAQHVAAQADATVSIQDSPAYTQLRACARRIVSEDDWLRAGLSCPAPWYNFCYCRGDLRTVATKYISSCIFTDCQYNSVDYTSVVSIYDAYCATALLASPTPTPPATAPDHAVTVTSTISPGGTAVVIVATTIVHDSAGGSASSAAPGRSPPPSRLAALAVCGAVAAATATVLFCGLVSAG
ncbi:hypothetical protein B0T26DRAFT_720985 [Lasiosphaeria miniovina]|uniref:Extracellular membrane protein CFEM domain-containing protein n=1 Tax=Lasiosphaeria miniovina TaxID=1954250 RepID=A0AA40A505_9PEZI|nr:uncharacterized protein B0T26DRAFT_720985 [Lasiosphaeria miniovina]KAK0709261.1 hypothetical protein B0T26DRAFT_720985 [Lasiosphaeria miniovina]